MRYRKIQPPVHLKPYVECFFIWECTLDQPLRVESPPAGFSSVVFNYGEPYHVSNFKFDEPKLVPKAFLTGQSTRNYELSLIGTIGMVGIVFRPAGLGTLFNFPLAELADERIDLRDLLKSQEVADLSDKISDSTTYQERIWLLLEFLNLKLLQNEHRFDNIDYAANRIVDANGIMNVQELMNDLYMCRRQFERKFLQKVGLSPKYYARIRRLGHICSLMAGKRKVNWQHLLYDCDYYDQAHFIKDFTAFLGRTPTDYLQNNVELVHFLKQS